MAINTPLSRFNESNEHYTLFQLLSHKDLKGTVEKLAQFLGRSLSEDDIAKVVDHCTFANMKKNPMTSPDSITKHKIAKRENKPEEQLMEENKLNKSAKSFMRKGE